MSQGSFHERLEHIGATELVKSPTEPADAGDNLASSFLRTLFSELFIVAIAFLSGLGSCVFALLVQFHYLTDRGVYKPIPGDLSVTHLGDLTIITLVIAIIVSFVVAQILKLKSLVRSGAQLLGFLFGLFGMDFLVELMPTVFASLFSSEWVFRVLGHL